MQAVDIKTIYVTEKLDHRLVAASPIGPTWTGNMEKSDIVAGILTRRLAGLDALFDCSGDQQAFDQAIRLHKPVGTFLIIGISRN